AGGQRAYGGLYVVARGKRFVPMLYFYFGGGGSKLEADVAALLDSAEIPGAGPDKVALFGAGDLVGDWGAWGAAVASYVTASGSYAGDASTVTAEGLTLKADRTFRTWFKGMSSGRGLQSEDTGTWSVVDARLLETGKAKKTYRWVLGVGADA